MGAGAHVVTQIHQQGHYLSQGRVTQYLADPPALLEPEGKAVGRQVVPDRGWTLLAEDPVDAGRARAASSTGSHGAV